MFKKRGPKNNLKRKNMEEGTSSPEENNSPRAEEPNQLPRKRRKVLKLINRMSVINA